MTGEQKQQPTPAPVFLCAADELDAAIDAYQYARKTGTACAVVHRPDGLYQPRVLPLPKSARVVAVVNAKKRRTG